MTEHLPGGTAEIESLLADRERLQGWLDRLETTAAAAPSSVRARVRADYEGRLAEVVAQLRGFTTALTASLEMVRSQLAHLRSLKGEVEEARAEARLRHEVGEFGQEEWAAIDNDCDGKLQGLGGDIGRLTDEVAKLEDVLALVRPEEEKPGPEPVVEAAAPRRAPGDDVDVEVIEAEEVTLVSHAKVSDEDLPVYTEPGQADEETREATRPASVEAPRFTPRAGEVRPRERERPTRTIRFPQPAPETPASTGGVDEMTFLKSVILDSPGQARGQAAEGKGTMKGAGRGPSTAAKTLKCTECGAMNRPTEWYCERCGAELAAL
jgi:hypothetical protein